MESRQIGADSCEQADGLKIHSLIADWLALSAREHGGIQTRVYPPFDWPESDVGGHVPFRVRMNRAKRARPLPAGYAGRKGTCRRP